MLIAASFAWHFYISGVVVETKFEDGQHFIMLRENRGVWLNVSMAVYWVHFAIEKAMFAVCSSVVIWAAWRLIWHGHFKN
jgi:hypothetical protein